MQLPSISGTYICCVYRILILICCDTLLHLSKLIFLANVGVLLFDIVQPPITAKRISNFMGSCAVDPLIWVVDVLDYKN